MHQLAMSGQQAWRGATAKSDPKPQGEELPEPEEDSGKPGSLRKPDLNLEDKLTRGVRRTLSIMSTRLHSSQQAAGGPGSAGDSSHRRFSSHFRGQGNEWLKMWLWSKPLGLWT